MNISPITPTCPPWMQFIPIQSLRQLVSYTIFTLLGASFCGFLISSSGGGRLDYWALLPAFAGSSYFLFRALPSKVSLKTSDVAERDGTIQLVAGKLRKLGYREISRSETVMNTTVQYAHAFPKIFRWNENCLTIAVASDAVEITGPIATLESICRSLSNEGRPQF